MSDYELDGSPAKHLLRVGDSWLDTTNDPYLLKTWDGANWVVNDYLKALPIILGTAGYFAGGFLSDNSVVTRVDKITFVNDAVSSILSGTSVGRTAAAGFNSLIAGYAAGSVQFGTSFTLSSIDKLVFVGDTCSVIVSQLSLARGTQAGVNSAFAGYSIGGTDDSYTAYNRVDKLVFSSDSNSSLVSNASQTIQYAEGFENTVAGYVGGGAAFGPNGFTSRLDKLTFASDNCSLIISSLSLARDYGTCYKSSAYGYVAGGNDNILHSMIDRLSFSTDSVSTILATLSTGTYSAAGSSSSLAGYSAGGRVGVGYSHTSVVEKLLFLNESNASIASGLSSNRSTAAGFENLN